MVRVEDNLGGLGGCRTGDRGPRLLLPEQFVGRILDRNAIHVRGSSHVGHLPFFVVDGDHQVLLHPAEGSGG